MAATQTVVQSIPQCNSSITVSHIPRHGVLTLYGYGIAVRVDRGHLTVEDGIGADRRKLRLPRVGHGLRRLVVIGSDGVVSLSALHWLADQDASLVVLDRDGSVLFTTGPVRPSDARLRRAQALAIGNGMDATIARELISQKLAAQERVALEKLRDEESAREIGEHRLALAEAETVDEIRSLESCGAASYWAAWRNLPITFPRNDLPRVPAHWRVFETRKSLLSGSQRLATNPLNAMLNYLYAILESESRLAAATLGLDPGLGFIHLDTPARDSLACDLMEAVRPRVDSYVLDWVRQQPLRREWFFEQRDGNCRLMAPFAVRLSETAPMWARAVAPIAEWTARILWGSRRKRSRDATLPTRLTQRHKREAKGALSLQPSETEPKRGRICHRCGATIRGQKHCAQCAVGIAKERIADVARVGRLHAHSTEAEVRRGQTQRRQRSAEISWSPSLQPDWLTEEFYAEKIQPLLTTISGATIAKALGVSIGYSCQVRKGHRPHPRHWEKLARLARNVKPAELMVQASCTD